MHERTAVNLVIRPTLRLLGERFQGFDAERMLAAIALQESRFTHRVQIGGPAHGFWQFERGGGVRGVLTHPSSKPFAESLCETLGYQATADAVYAAIVDNDALACGFARLLLKTDPNPLPNDEAAGWMYYARNWRPGKPHPETWPEMWRRATEACL